MLHLTAEYYAPQDLIVRKGDIDERMYFIEKGSCTATIDDSGKPKKLTSGHYFGEGAILVKDFKIDITVVSENWVQLITLSFQEFQRLLEKYPNARKHVFRWLTEHKSSNPNIAEHFLRKHSSVMDDEKTDKLTSMETKIRELTVQNQLIMAALSLATENGNDQSSDKDKYLFYEN